LQQKGDIEDIRNMAESSDLKGVEDVFVNNAASFDMLVNRPSNMLPQ